MSKLWYSYVTGDTCAVCADELSCKEMGVSVGLGEWTHVIGQIFVKGAHCNVISVLNAWCVFIDSGITSPWNVVF